MLRGRFGTLPEEVAQALASADMDRLDAMLAHAATESLEELRARLVVS